MNGASTLSQIEHSGIIAIVRLAAAAPLADVAEALAAGGIDALEFTITTPGALHGIEESRARLEGRALVGAGTVLDESTARAAIDAGATFIVTPTLTLDVIAVCRREGIPVFPGAMTPTEILAAWQAGADIVKVFPASALGPDYIRQVRAPLPQVKLMPTGGISAANAQEYFAAGAVAVGVGGRLVDAAVVAEGRFDLLTERARELVTAVRMSRGSSTVLRRG
ncbi:MAG TPA: bifunctional 4-hydroxy-2-oxoglutarate aldolase/2-dehydro-3-deoxy-phosphogluconate aldolase [bacterium]|nr:bifunctional 4-hydroxy-2-oxoglutarate aldolase/2-dehydro-3-deoxy-phosphogluconate aldolase [bacterium]